MGKITIGGFDAANASDDQLHAVQGAVQKAMNAGGGWLTLGAKDGKAANVCWVGPGIPVILEFDSVPEGDERVL